VISLDTVKSHVAHIMAKLGVANRTQAVAVPCQESETVADA
jgi:DNA-binding NarL/FixJ family response regulator